MNASRQVAPTTDPLSAKDDNVAELIEQNLMTSLRMTQQVAKWMIKHAADGERGEEPIGSIINLSSVAARITQRGLLGFSISCAAVEQMTRSMAVSLAPHRIRVNAVAFGSVLSASLNDLLNEAPEYREMIHEGTPLGRIAPPSDVAETVQYLASQGSSFVTGQVLTVDGGRSVLDPVTAPTH